MILGLGCSSKSNITFENIDGFSSEVNSELELFFNETETHPGRKIAVFDGDGTVLGQVPNYLADECLYSFAAENPDRKKELIDKMKIQSNVSLDYVQNRVRYMSGDSLNYWRELGSKDFSNYYSTKIYAPMKALIKTLQKNNFEVWIVSASPEAMYQKFLSEQLEIPITRIIGVKSVIRNGIITDEIIHPVPQDHGKKEAIESFIQDKPLFAAGNSRGDKEMIEFASNINMIVNPDEYIASDQKESIAQYARSKNWLIVNISDTTLTNFPSLSTKVYGIKPNKPTIVK
jgi:phosphoserine phosphatase